MYLIGMATSNLNIYWLFILIVILTDYYIIHIY